MKKNRHARTRSERPQTPRVVTTLLTSKSLKFWTHASNDLCETCNMGGDLLSCSYCNVSYHNDAPCLDESQVIAASLRNSESYEWPCPACFNAGVKAHQRKKLAPNPAAGGGKKHKGSRGLFLASVIYSNVGAMRYRGRGAVLGARNRTNSLAKGLFPKKGGFPIPTAVRPSVAASLEPKNPGFKSRRPRLIPSSPFSPQGPPGSRASDSASPSP